LKARTIGWNIRNKKNEGNRARRRKRVQEKEGARGVIGREQEAEKKTSQTGIEKKKKRRRKII